MCYNFIVGSSESLNESLLSSFSGDLNEHRADSERARASLKVVGEVLLYAALVPVIEQQLMKNSLWSYYKTIEMPALIITLHMLLNGVLIHNDELVNTREELIVMTTF